MEKVGSRKTSVSLGSRSAIVDEIKKREDRSRSAVIRRAIDYYYLMNYAPEVKAEPGEIKELEKALQDAKAGRGVTLKELKQEYDLGTARSTKSKKRVTKT